MALTEHHRNALYQGLTRTIGDEEAVAAMLSQFPARDTDEPATKDFVRSELIAQEDRMAERFATKDFVRSELIAQEDRMAERFATKDFVRAEVSGLDAKVDIGFTECRAEIAAVEHRLSERITERASEIMDFVHRELRTYFVWSYGAMFVLLAAVVTAAKILE